MKKSFSSCRRRKDDEINRINCSCALRCLLQSMRRRETMRERERKGQGERECMCKKEKDNERREESERAKRRENNFG